MADYRDYSHTSIGLLGNNEQGGLLEKYAGKLPHPILWFHGAGDYFPGLVLSAGVIHSPHQYRFSIYAGGWGGPYNFANDLFIGGVNAHLSYLSSKGYDTSKVAVIGGSMGAMTACYFASMFPSRVKAMVLMIPLLDLAWAYDNLDGIPAFAGMRPEAAAAYGGEANMRAQSALRSPVAVAKYISHIPKEIYYSSTDPVYNSAQLDRMRFESGARLYNTGTGGHDFVNMPEQRMADFIRKHMGYGP